MCESIPVANSRVRVPFRFPSSVDKILIRLFDSDETCQTGLVGLHACGQLSVDILRLFIEDPNCQSLVLVSCCYGRVGSMGNRMDFPISKFFKARNVTLSKAALRTASESVAERRKVSREEFDRSNLTLFHRLVAEYIFDTELGGAKNYRCGKNSRKPFSSFALYFKTLRMNLAIRKDGLLLREICDSELEQIYATLMTAETKQRIIGCLHFKFSLGSLLESLLLYDRMLYLMEHGIATVSAVAVFDENISPTNIAIVACK